VIRTVVAGFALGASFMASMMPAGAASNYSGCNSESLCVYQSSGGNGGVRSIPIPSLPSAWVNFTTQKFDNNAKVNNQISSVWVHSTRGNICVDFAQTSDGDGWIWGMSSSVTGDPQAAGKANVPGSYNDQITSYRFFDCIH
jgi:hypothetical protein